MSITKGLEDGGGGLEEIRRKVLGVWMRAKEYGGGLMEYGGR